jgi:hypothetical protein
MSLDGKENKMQSAKGGAFLSTSPKPNDVMGLMGRQVSKITKKIMPNSGNNGGGGGGGGAGSAAGGGDVMQDLFIAYTTEQTASIPKLLQADTVLAKQLAQLQGKLELEMMNLKTSYELAKQQLVAEAQLRNELPFDASELMRHAAKRASSKRGGV